MNRPGEEAGDVLDAFIGALGMPRSLGAVGIGPENFDVIAMRSPTSLHESRVYSPENFRSSVQKDFCNSI